MLEYYRYKEVSDLYAQNREEEARRLLTDLQARYIAMCDENATLRLRVQEFENVLYMANNLVFDGSSYWLLTGSVRQGPFCQICYEREGALIRLEHLDDELICPMCNASRERPPVRPEMPRRSPRTAKIIPFAR
jgi:hypothetical protein